ncbi:hypothetical protein HA402_011451 [Bradysia odoriphaga]|nr:hypothetical protein HA402_011451 [Bradysia odoriphaga]
MSDGSVAYSIKQNSSEVMLSENPDDRRSTSQYEIKPSQTEGFKQQAVKEIISNVLIEVLDGKQYQSTHIAEWISKISDTISTQLKELNMRRYKHIVQVVILQQTGAGCKYIARCRWDAESDVQVSNYFTNESMACIVTVFGVFMY